MIAFCTVTARPGRDPEDEENISLYFFKVLLETYAQYAQYKVMLILNTLDWHILYDILENQPLRTVTVLCPLTAAVTVRALSV